MFALRYCDIKNGGDIFKAIASDTWSMFSNDYKNALLALIKPPPKALGRKSSWI